jgi:hypothetical protein
LLQGAFSHNGFTENFIDQTDGFFHKVISQNKIDGPIIATHTVNDHAVGIAYPLASRILLSLTTISMGMERIAPDGRSHWSRRQRPHS